MDRIENRALILGRSFGVYGHALALLDLEYEIFFPSTYRGEIWSRREYISLQEKCFFLENPIPDITAFGLVCCARRPKENAAIADALLQTTYRGQLIIEKPIAPNPDEAIRLGSELSTAKIKWDVPYLFLYTDWFEPVRKAVKAGEKISINWTHNATFPQGHWKATSDEGGGTVSYYLIHLLALFVQLDQPCPLERRSSNSWLLQGPLVTAAFETGSIMKFSIMQGDRVIFQNESPFGAAPARGKPDTRIAALKNFYTNVLARKDQREIRMFHCDVHQRWRDAID